MDLNGNGMLTPAELRRAANLPEPPAGCRCEGSGRDLDWRALFRKLFP
jgi:hypothetical protein